jgi:hypothetical protein
VPNSVLRFRPSAAVAKKAGLPAAQADKQQIYVLTGAKIEPVPVKFGLSDGKYTAVASNELQSGARVVVRATMSGDASSSSTPATTATPRIPRM